MKKKLKVVNLPQFQALVRSIAAENPDHIYVRNKGGGCDYHATARNGNKGCIIGEALARLGATQALLKRLGSQWARSVLPSLGFDAETTEWATRVQQNQDTAGTTWAEAVEDA